MSRVESRTKERLAELLREAPRLCEIRTLGDIGAELGVSRERIRQLLPAPPVNRRKLRQQNRLAEESRKLAEYAESHPLALLPVSRGGPRKSDIARAIGIQVMELSKLWKLCGYPDRLLAGITVTQSPAELARYRYHNTPGRKEMSNAATRRWQAAHPEQWRAVAQRARAKYYAKKLSQAARL